MEISEEQLEVMIAQRLLARAEGTVKQNKKPAVNKSSADPTQENKLPASGYEALAMVEPDFVKIEKNLASFGFFTPSSKRIKNAKAKTITFTRWVDGKRIEAKVTIAPAALYGLPITADQDKFIAFQKVIEGLRQEQGVVKNPVGFTSADMLRLLGRNKDSGKNYQDIIEWLDVMTTTTILSEGAVYFAGKSVWAKDRFHVFDRAVSVGKEMPGGEVADKNYVWLSEWQLENINNNYLLPIDYDAYKQLKNHIAKALVPLLQIWLYASRDNGYFEKRYDELCQMLSITQYRKPSDIKRWFASSLDELKEHGYLADWQIEKTSDGKAYKIVFYHGEKFHRDRRRRIEQGKQNGPRRKPRLVATSIEPSPEQGSGPPPEPQVSEANLTDEQKHYFKLLNMEFGVIATKAYDLITTKFDQSKKQLDAWSYRNIKPNNPAGWIIEAVESDYALPEPYLAYKAKQEGHLKAQARREAINACTLCNDSGYRIIRAKHPDTGQDYEAFKECTHNPEIESKFVSVL
jgi:hypothetical protein